MVKIKKLNFKSQNDLIHPNKSISTHNNNAAFIVLYSLVTLVLYSQSTR